MSSKGKTLIGCNVRHCIFLITTFFLLSDQVCSFVISRSPLATHRVVRCKRLHKVGARGGQKTKLSQSAEQNNENDFINLPRKAVQIYTEYASRLWEETNTDARKKIAKEKGTASIQRVQHMLQGEEYADFSNVSLATRTNLFEACNEMLVETGHEDLVQDSISISSNSNSTEATALMNDTLVSTKPIVINEEKTVKKEKITKVNCIWCNDGIRCCLLGLFWKLYLHWSFHINDYSWPARILSYGNEYRSIPRACSSSNRGLLYVLDSNVCS